MKKFFILCLLAVLFFGNPNIEDFKTEAHRRIDAEQSSMRAGWSGVTKATGIDWLSKQAGFGNYEICRKNMYLFSFFAVKNSKLLDSSQNVAVGIGGAHQVFAQKVPEKTEGVQQTVIDKLLSLADSLEYNECETAHKSGDMTGL